MSFGNLAKMAQQMQAEMARVQGELETLTVQGSAGGGAVMATVTGKQEPVARLIEAFARLPGIGPKTAQRLTFHLLRAPESEARTLAAALVAVRDEVVFCEECFNIAAGPRCPL